MYEEEDIMTNLHTEPENEERTRKNGCFIACLLKKQDLVSFYKYAILMHNVQYNARLICYTYTYVQHNARLICRN